jgi:hypothetical protein
VIAVAAEPPIRRLREAHTLQYNRLPGWFPGWAKRSAPLLAWIRICPRSHAQVHVWARRTNFGWREVEQQLSWLWNEGKIAGGARHGWWAR